MDAEVVRYVTAANQGDVATTTQYMVVGIAYFVGIGVVLLLIPPAAAFFSIRFRKPHETASITDYSRHSGVLGSVSVWIPGTGALLGLVVIVPTLFGLAIANALRMRLNRDAVLYSLLAILWLLTLALLGVLLPNLPWYAFLLPNSAFAYFVDRRMRANVATSRLQNPDIQVESAALGTGILVAVAAVAVSVVLYLLVVGSFRLFAALVRG